MNAHIRTTGMHKKGRFIVPKAPRSREYIEKGDETRYRCIESDCRLTLKRNGHTHEMWRRVLWHTTQINSTNARYTHPPTRVVRTISSTSARYTHPSTNRIHDKNSHQQYEGGVHPPVNKSYSRQVLTSAIRRRGSSIRRLTAAWGTPAASASAASAPFGC